MRAPLPPLALVFALGAAGCAGMSSTEQRALTGAGGGAAGGAIIGALAGNAGLGALIGAGVGGAGGYLFDQSKRAEQRAYRQGYQNASLADQIRQAEQRAYRQGYRQGQAGR